jgi:hypothetical protein
VSAGSKAKQRAAASVDEHAATEPGIAAYTEATHVEWVNAADLRTATPEEIELLAATGC